MIVVEWKLTTFLRQEPWLDAPPRTRGVARLRAARGATGDPTRAWWRVQPRLLTQKRGQFLQQYTDAGKSIFLFSYIQQPTVNNIIEYIQVYNFHIYMEIYSWNIHVFHKYMLKHNKQEQTKMPAFWEYPQQTNDYPYYWFILDPKSKQDKIKFKKIAEKFTFFNFSKSFTHSTPLEVA